VNYSYWNVQVLCILYTRMCRLLHDFSFTCDGVLEDRSFSAIYLPDLRVRQYIAFRLEEVLETKYIMQQLPLPSSYYTILNALLLNKQNCE